MFALVRGEPRRGGALLPGFRVSGWGTHVEGRRDLCSRLGEMDDLEEEGFLEAGKGSRSKETPGCVPGLAKSEVVEVVVVVVVVVVVIRKDASFRRRPPLPPPAPPRKTVECF